MLRLRPSLQRLPLLRCASSSTTVPSSSAAPAKFSETNTYRKSTAFKTVIDDPTMPPVEPGMQYHSKYGLGPKLGSDWYDTFRYAKIRNKSIAFSLSMFLIYFCILREENDIDKRLDQPLWKHVPSIEKDMLERSLIIAETKGHDTAKLKAQLLNFEERQRKMMMRHGKDDEFDE